MYDLDVLEKIADNMQVQITDEAVPFENSGEIIASLDLGQLETDGAALSQHSIDSEEQATLYSGPYDFRIALFSNELIEGEPEFVQKEAFFFHIGYYNWLMNQPEDEPIVIIVHGVFPDMADEDTAHDIRSRRFSRDEVKRRIEHEKEKYGWEFLFLTANIDAVETARHIGINADRAVNYHADSRGTEVAYDAVAETVCMARMGCPSPRTGIRASGTTSRVRKGNQKREN